jgi:hypothetical protein
MTNKVVKIGDFNMAKVLKGKFSQTAAGTPFYAGPEIWKHEP